MTRPTKERLADIKARERHAMISDLGKVLFIFVVGGYTLFAIYLWGPYIIRGVQDRIGSW